MALPRARPRSWRSRVQSPSAPGLRLRGVMTHAGHSYGPSDPADVVPIAGPNATLRRTPRRRSAPPACRAISSASARRRRFSTPITCAALPRRAPASHALGSGAALAQSLPHGGYRGVGARLGDRTRSRRAFADLDAGALALSKDIGANKYLPDAGYGYVCDVRTAAGSAPFRSMSFIRSTARLPSTMKPGSRDSPSAASCACCRTMPVSRVRATRRSTPSAASRWLRASRASTGGESFLSTDLFPKTGSHPRSGSRTCFSGSCSHPLPGGQARRTLIVPLGSVGEGGGERMMRPPSKVTLRRCTVPVKL